MRSGMLCTLTLIAALSCAQLRAQDADVTADVRCLLVGFNVSAADAHLQAAGQVLGMYYMGRLDAHVPKLDLESLIIQQVGVMSSADFATEAIRCGNAFADKGRQIKQIGKDLIEREQAENPPAQQKPGERP